ncbi:unnamed protein product [Calypogeia fissa]
MCPISEPAVHRCGPSRPKPLLLLQSNPIHKKLPTIIHNGKPVAELLVILEYLEDVWRQQVRLMPTDPFERAKVRFWSDFIYKNIVSSRDTRTARSGSPEQQAAQQESVKNLKILEIAMADSSTEGPFFIGETFGFLDVALAPLEYTLAGAERLGGLVVPGPAEIP